MSPRTLVVGSAFRNSAHYLTRYFTQVAWLKESLSGRFNVRVSAIEGDSADDTRAQLSHVAGLFCIDCAVTTCAHGQRWFGSTEQPDRLTALSQVGNAILDSVRESDDILWYVESDLIWDATTVNTLIKNLAESVAPSRADAVFDSISPLVFAGAAFYDIWGFRGMDGERYSPFHPYHEDLLGHEEPGLRELTSAGSALLMAGYLARDKHARMTTGALVEFCGNARKYGYRFAVNPQLRINHP